jgi:hypothetical protein
MDESPGLAALAAFCAGCIVGGLIVFALVRYGYGLRAAAMPATRPRLALQASDHAAHVAMSEGLRVPVQDDATGRAFFDWTPPATVISQPTSTIEFRLRTPGDFEPRVYEFTRRDLRRFLELATPARSEWHGSKDTYGDLLEWARVAGWVTSAGKGWAWMRDWRTLAHRVMSLRDRHDVTL